MPSQTEKDTTNPPNIKIKRDGQQFDLSEIFSQLPWLTQKKHFLECTFSGKETQGCFIQSKESPDVIQFMLFKKEPMSEGGGAYIFEEFIRGEASENNIVFFSPKNRRILRRIKSERIENSISLQIDFFNNEISGLAKLYETPIFISLGENAPANTIIISQKHPGEDFDYFSQKNDFSTLNLQCHIHLAINLCFCLLELKYRGLVHRDIKQENLIFDETSGEFKLIDFELTARKKAADDSQFLPTGIDRLAPEVLRREVSRCTALLSNTVPQSIQHNAVICPSYSYSSDLYNAVDIILNVFNAHNASYFKMRTTATSKRKSVEEKFEFYKSLQSSPYYFRGFLNKIHPKDPLWDQAGQEWPALSPHSDEDLKDLNEQEKALYDIVFAMAQQEYKERITAEEALDGFLSEYIKSSPSFDELNKIWQKVIYFHHIHQHDLERVHQGKLDRTLYDETIEDTLEQSALGCHLPKTQAALNANPKLKGQLDCSFLLRHLLEEIKKNNLEALQTALDQHEINLFAQLPEMEESIFSQLKNNPAWRGFFLQNETALSAQAEAIGEDAKNAWEQELQKKQWIENFPNINLETAVNCYCKRAMH